jgi:hypothetical protein
MIEGLGGMVRTLLGCLGCASLVALAALTALALLLWGRP